MMLLRLFAEFFKAGLFAVGGGLATLPFLSDMGEKTGWFTASDLADMIAVSESTPGPIGVNMATYVGFTVHGWLGAVTATCGLVLPSLLVILLIAAVLKNYRENPCVISVFYAIRPASTALITCAWIAVLRLSLLRVEDYAASGRWTDLFFWKGLVLALLLYLLTNKCKKTKKLHPIVFILFSALIGIVFKF